MAVVGASALSASCPGRVLLLLVLQRELGACMYTMVKELTAIDASRGAEMLEEEHDCVSISASSTRHARRFCMSQAQSGPLCDSAMREASLPCK